MGHKTTVIETYQEDTTFETSTYKFITYRGFMDVSK